jgi:hypothetical protein
MFNHCRLLLLALLVTSVSIYAEEFEIPFVVRDTCPFEGCTFGEWEVLKDTNVFQSPNKNASINGKLNSGTKVQVLTGIEHITPGEAKITHKPHSKAEQFDSNKKIYILNDLGEGRSQVFHNGKFIEIKIARSTTRCAEEPNWRYCWVKVLREPSSEWWVKVKGMGWVLTAPQSLRPLNAFS